MNNDYTTQANPAQFTPEQLNNLYPEIYNDTYPLIVQMSDEIIKREYALTEVTINTFVDNIIKMSGMWDEDDEINQKIDEAIPVQIGFNRRPFRGNRRRSHNRNTLRDIVRILLLRELFGRR